MRGSGKLTGCEYTLVVLIYFRDTHTTFTDADLIPGPMTVHFLHFDGSYHSTQLTNPCQFHSLADENPP